MLIYWYIFNIFYETVKDVIDTCQPLKTARLKGDQKWMTIEIKTEIKQRQKLWHRRKYDEWKMQANKVTKIIKKRKRSYYKRFTNMNTNWWDEVRESNSTTTESGRTSLLLENSSRTNDTYSIEAAGWWCSTAVRSDSKQVRAAGQLERASAGGTDSIIAETISESFPGAK